MARAKGRKGTVRMPEKLEHRAIADLVPYARNARTHSDEQVAQIAASMREFGWTNPILIDSAGGIIAGHGRVLAAALLKLKTVPVIDIGDLSEVQRRAYVLADNRLALSADWDFELLAVELDELNDAGFALPLIGFTTDELAEMIGTPITGPEPEPDPPSAPKVHTCPECGHEFGG